MDAQLALHLDAARPILSLSDLSDEERAVASALRWGRANARKVSEIAAATGVASRRVQELTHQLLHVHGWPVGTSMREPFGNYLIDNPEELVATASLLRSRGLSQLRGATTLERMSKGRYLQDVQAEICAVEPKTEISERG